MNNLLCLGPWKLPTTSQRRLVPRVVKKHMVFTGSLLTTNTQRVSRVQQKSAVIFSENIIVPTSCMHASHSKSPSSNCAATQRLVVLKVFAPDLPLTLFPNNGRSVLTRASKRIIPGRVRQRGSNKINASNLSESAQDSIS